MTNTATGFLRGPYGVAAPALLAAAVTVLLDFALLAWAALLIGAAAAFIASLWLLPSGRPAEPAGMRVVVTASALASGLIAGLLTAAVLDLWLIEAVAYGIGALAGGAVGPLVHRRIPATLALAMVAVAAAVVLSLLVTAVLLTATGVDALFTFSQMLGYGVQPDSLVKVLNDGTTFYLSAVAVAIGFKMKLFNIGVDGQYRLAALLAAAVGGQWVLPPVVHQVVVIVVAVAVGGMWAGIAGYLKVTRGVSEVISTIMLNSIATGITAYLLHTDRLAVELGTNNIGTKPIPESGQVPGIPTGFMGANTEIYGLVFLAIAVGVGYWVLLNRTRFGFDLRATGMSATAALASGVNVKKMVVWSMVISGGVAGLVGVPQLLGYSHHYAQDFPAGLGFIGIGIALLGRNHPVGIALAALFWAFLNQSSQILDFQDPPIPKEIAVVTQATIVLTVVVVYEVVHRWGRRYEQQLVGAELGRAGVSA
ncbi:nucleoside ABC transporter membrane protein [Murinocardiopsis flavida]|uniref:Nucleoside ABC transporter membrane protein n=1 Tax=Murinocardiopsis flavida TaxID=645275 RepID=A0A2P8DH32_9ACTN|nr:ABC transporter permease [Murinocardiopsis flavida]PSK96532.1 nucleoside ABC transporter membrane protein [Murinocardiopsis flavida]